MLIFFVLFWFFNQLNWLLISVKILLVLGVLHVLDSQKTNILTVKKVSDLFYITVL